VLFSAPGAKIRERDMSGNTNQAANQDHMDSTTMVDRAIQGASKLSETAQALDEISRSTCLLALNVAIAADQPGKLGKNLVDVSRDVRQLASRSASTLADLQIMLHALEKGADGVNVASKAAIDEAVASFCR
jgi:methyl-accepting chemotaxis protein